MKRSAALALFLAAALAAGACGGSQVAAQASDNAAIAQRATDPRTNDPTASRPAPTSTGTVLAGSPSSAGTSAITGNPVGGAAATASEAPPTRIGARHVLVQWMGSERAPSSVVRTRDQARAIIEEVYKRAKAGDDFARLAVEYSDEPGAGGRGGSLGRFGHGQMVPAFEEAAFKLKVGEVSAIVETPFGFHVIQRTE